MSRLLAPGLRLVPASNRSALTGAGTNTYIIGQGDVAIIDPGPDDPDHMRAIVAALPEGSRVRYILVTHSHVDHSLLARPLADDFAAPVVAYGDRYAGRSALMTELANRIGLGGGEGAHQAFCPDQTLADDETLDLGGSTIKAIWTPGHFGNHMCFIWRGVAFSGDHVMGWASSLVSPPDGDLDAYMTSLDRLEAAHPRVLYPGHGPEVVNPVARIGELRVHRLEREAEIRAELSLKACAISDLVEKIYHDIPRQLHSAAARNVLAHLVALCARGEVEARPDIGPDAIFFAR